MREPDVGKLKRSITVKQAREWMAYYARCPFGPLRDDYHNAYLMSFVSHMFGGKGRKPEIEELLTFDPQRGSGTKSVGTAEGLQMMDRVLRRG